MEPAAAPGTSTATGPCSPLKARCLRFQFSTSTVNIENHNGTWEFSVLTWPVSGFVSVISDFLAGVHWLTKDQLFTLIEHLNCLSRNWYQRYQFTSDAVTPISPNSRSRLRIWTGNGAALPRR